MEILEVALHSFLLRLSHTLLVHQSLNIILQVSVPKMSKVEMRPVLHQIGLVHRSTIIMVVVTNLPPVITRRLLISNRLVLVLLAA